MKLSIDDLEALCREITSALQNKKLRHVVGIDKEGFVFVFTGGPPHPKLLISTARPPTIYLTKSRPHPHPTSFSKELEQRLLGDTFRVAHLKGEDRTVIVDFTSHRLEAILIPGYTNLSLYHKEELLLSLHPLVALPPSRATFRSPSSMTSAQIEEALAEANFQKAKSNALKASRQKIVRCRNRIERLRACLDEAMDWDKAQHKADLLQANFHRLQKGMESLSVADWTCEGEQILLELDPKKAPQEEVKRFYMRAKKLRRAIDPLEHQLQEKGKQLDELQLDHLQLENATDVDQLPKPKPLRHDAQAPRRLPYRTFFSESGREILVGRGERDNDQLTFHIAKGSDLWFHTHNIGGAHVVLRTKKGEEADEEAIRDAAQLALLYSANKGLEVADVVMTACKWVNKPKRAKAGQVTLADKRILFVRPDRERIRQIQSRDSRKR